MRKILVFFLLAATLAWAAGLWIDPPTRNMRSLMHELYYLNGVIAWGLMALPILIAARPAWFMLLAAGTPDLLMWHRRIGIAAVALSVIHAFTRPLFSPLVQPLALEPVPRIVRGAVSGGLQGLWGALRPAAVTSSVAATVLACVLLALALLPVLKAPWWARVHKLFALVFIVLALHCVRLFEPGDWLLPLGWVNAAVSAAGLWYSVKVLLPRRGAPA